MFDIFGTDASSKKKRTLTTAQLKDFKAAIGKCEICRKKYPSSVLQHHHIRPKEKGGSDSLLTNVIAVCGTCHNKVHAGYYTQKQLREILKKRPKKVIEHIKAIDRRRQSVKRKKNSQSTMLNTDILGMDIPDPFMPSKKGKSRKKKDDWFKL